MSDFLTLEQLQAESFDLADLPPTPLTGLDGNPYWETRVLEELGLIDPED